MPLFRIALANLEHPADPEASVRVAVDAMSQAAGAGAQIVCFPECFVPGYRGMGKVVPPPDAAFLARAHARAAHAAGESGIAVVLGTERIVDGALRATALVVGADGAILGYQDKVQIDPSEEGTYTPGTDRHIFHAGSLTFGVAICHEGWRYPETVRWSVRRGAQIVFHPHFHIAEPAVFSPLPSRIRRIRFTKKPRCAARRKITVSSRPSTSPVKARRPPQR
jgi:predicted amidohydrolase